MGMYCEVSVAASKQDAGHFSGGSLLGGLFGAKTSTTQGVSLEKSWHGLHYLLTGQVWDGQGPLAFLLAGGEELGDDEESGDRWFTPEETAEIHEALARVSDDQLWSRFDAEEMEQQEIYPGIWDEPEEDLKEEYLGYFTELKQVIESAVLGGQGLKVSIG